MHRRSNPTLPESYLAALDECARRPRVWLVTGVGGFIGSSILEQLLALGQPVIGLDNLSTGSQRNIDEVLAAHPEAAKSFRMIHGDVRDLETCREACRGVDTVLHQAAIDSTPRSVVDSAESNAVNVSGFLNMLIAARECHVRRFVYASSSSVYGESATQPHVEDHAASPLAHSGLTKFVNELYASTFQRVYGLEVIGLRYFNVFGQRQKPNGEYAGAIPRWIESLFTGTRCIVSGSGETARDFCFVANAVQANILAAVAPQSATNEVYNIACGEVTTLQELFRMIRLGLAGFTGTIAEDPVYEGIRPGESRISFASIARAKEGLGYSPSHSVSQGLSETIGWYVANSGRSGARVIPMLGDSRSAELEGVT